MSENNDESKLAKQLKQSKKKTTAEQVQEQIVEENFPAPAPTPALVALLKDPEKRTAEDARLLAESAALGLEGGAFAYTPNEPAYPFAPGTRLMFNGVRRLFAGWDNYPLLEPRSRFVVAAAEGPYSIIIAKIAGLEYRLALTKADVDEWVVEG